jgi:hypothetical protein
VTLFDVDDMERHALISECEHYRYTLTRIWDRSRPVLVWTMLNPSKADGLIDDPTIGRCIAFAKAWGYGGIVVVNLFAWRATDPTELEATLDAIGPENDRHLLAAVADQDVIAAWGASVPHYWRHRPAAVLELMRQHGARLHHLGLTKDGHPRHPLYLRGDTQPTRWAA